MTTRSTARDYREFRDTDYTNFRRKLLRTKGSQAQIELLKAARAGNSAFLDHLSHLGRDGVVPPPALTGRLTEFEFRMSPADTEQAVYSTLADLSPATACRSAFWACYTCDAIGRDQIQAVYLAAEGGNVSGGAARIDKALRAYSEGDSDQNGLGARLVDACVRSILRRAGGIPEVRGKRTVYVDCPFARAWWRVWIEEEVSNGDEEVACLVGNVLRVSQTYWEKIVDRIVSRNSTFGAPEVRRAFLLTLALEVESVRQEARGSESPMVKPTHLTRACRRVAALQGMRELSVLGPVALEKLMMNAVTGQ